MVEETPTMKFKGTALMAAVFLSLVLYYFFIDLPAEQKESSEKEKAEKIIPLEAEKIIEFTLTSNGNSISLKRNTLNTWDLKIPFSALGDSSEVDTFLSEIENLKKTRVVEDSPKDLSIYGLSSPSIKIGFKLENKSEETLLVGNESPMGGDIYFKRESHPSVMMASTSRSKFEKSVYHFRDKTILSFSTGTIKRIQIIKESNTLEFNKKDSLWEITGAVKAKGDNGAIMKFLQSIQFSKVKEFVEENPATLEPYGLDSPQLKLILDSEKGETYTIALGTLKKGKGYFGKINNASNIIITETKLFDTLSQRTAAFLDKTLLTFEENEIIELSLRANNETTHLVRDKSDSWGIQSPIKTTADLSTINSLLFDLREAKISEYIKISLDVPEAFGLDAPQKTFTLKMKDGKSVVLQFGNETSDGMQVFANRTSESSVFSISKKVVGKIFRSLHDLRNKKILDFESDEVSKIIIKTPDSLFELRKKDVDWTLEKPEKIETQHIGRDLIWTLKGLEFNSILSPSLPVEQTGMDNPLFTLSLWNINQEKTATLKVGNLLNKEQEYTVQANDQQYRVKNNLLDSIPLTIEKFKP
jgi:hypothetical protein